MGGIGGPELFLILVVVLLIFGPKKIPEVARGLGKGLREFRKFSTEFQREMNLSDALEEDKEKKLGPPRAMRSEIPPAESDPASTGGEGQSSGTVSRRDDDPPAGS
ncbi:MAG: twin-arginine translocase TatA/TatE family subunit [Gemmatimonadetes bacterium]|nr:twin-arginine translocase TatA/TatE family subunit [Gemmatimonadota bacterium]